MKISKPIAIIILLSTYLHTIKIKGNTGTNKLRDYHR